MLTQIGSGSWEMIPTNDLKESAHSFSKQVKEFLIKKTDYLLAESFSSEEMDALLLLSEHITSYIDSVDTGDDNNRGRYIIDMSSCVLKLLKAIPEFAPYLKRKFIGNRIG